MNETFTQTFRATDEVSPILRKISTEAAKTGVSLTDAGKALVALGEAGKAGGISGGALRKELAELSAELKSVSTSGEKTAGALSKITKEGVAVKQNWSTFASGAKSALSIISSGVAALAKPFKTAFAFESSTIRLSALVGGIGNAKKIVSALRDEAARAGMPFETLASTAGKLASVFSSHETIQTWTSAFKNLSAGLGRDINELTENFVKAKASGRFEGGFLDMFAQKGVNIFAPLSAMTGKTEKELRAMATAGTLAFEDVEKAILSTVSAGGAFENAAEKIASTAGGSVRRLAAEWEVLLSKLAEPVADALSPVIRALIASVSWLSAGAGTTFGKVGAVIAAAGVAAGALASGFYKVRSAIIAMTIAARGFGIALKTAIASTGVGIALVAVGSLVESLMTAADDAEARREEEERKAADAAREAAARAAAREQKEHARAKSNAEKIARELNDARKRAEAARAEIEKQIHAARTAAEEAPAAKIKLELDHAGFFSVEELDAEISRMQGLLALTAEQEAYLRRMLETRKEISSINAAAAASRRALTERVALLKAELAGTEQLLALKEKIYRADLRRQFIKAGVAPGDVSAAVEKYIGLENAVKAKRAADAAAKEAADKAQREAETAARAVAERRTETRGGATIWKKGRIISGGANEGADAQRGVESSFPSSPTGRVASAVPAAVDAFSIISKATQSTAENTRRLVELTQQQRKPCAAVLM